MFKRITPNKIGYTKMVKNKIELVPALITPCLEPGKIDLKSVRSLCEYLYREGATGVFAVSSTGEMPLMDARTRRQLLAAVREATGPAHTLYAGVSGTGVEQVLGYIGEATEEGAQVAVVMAPFFLKLDQDQFYDYARALADNSPLPLAFYHHLRMPTAIAEETVLRLAEHPNIIGFKETSGDGQRLKNLTRLLSRTDFRLFQGSEPMVLETLQLGGTGCVTALANIAPGLHRRLFDAFQQGRLSEAEQLQQQLNALWKIFRLPGVERSFGHFVQTLKLPLVQAGIIRSAATLLPGFSADDAFRRDVLGFFQQWQGLPSLQPPSPLAAG